MLEETGKVVCVEQNALWVETVTQSACGSCQARQGCGQHALGKVMSTSSQIRAVVRELSPNDYKVDQRVRIGIPEDVVVRGSLFVYLVPLLFMLLCATTVHEVLASEALTVLASVVGLFAGGMLVHWRSRQFKNDPRLQPVVLGFADI